MGKPQENNEFWVAPGPVSLYILDLLKLETTRHLFIFLLPRSLAFFFFFACLAVQQNSNIRCDLRNVSRVQRQGFEPILKKCSIWVRLLSGWSSVSFASITFSPLPRKQLLLSLDVILFPFHHTQLSKSHLAECKTTLVSWIWTWYRWFLTEEQSRVIDAFLWIIPL